MDKNSNPAGDPYDDSGGDAPAPTEGADKGEPTAIIPKNLCPGMKVGSTIELEIVGDHDDAYEVEYRKKGESETAEEEAPMPGGMAEMME